MDEDTNRVSAMDVWRSLAIACVGYINCENIDLELNGKVQEKVNSKRSRDGKSRLEPYYICKIRHSHSDSVNTGTGIKHSIRYDVRGHFRRLKSGETTWVREHQRGLSNDMYVPKVYSVTS